MTTGADAISRVQFTVTREDVEALYRERWKALGSAEFALARLHERRKLWRSVAICGTIVTFVYLYAIVMEWAVVRGPWFAACAIVTVSAWWTFFTTRDRIVHANFHMDMTKHLEEVGIDLYTGPCAVTVTNSGIRSTNTHFETMYEWSMVLDAATRDDAVCVHLVGGQTIRVPSRAFEAPNTPDQFRGLINARVAQAGFSPASRVVCYINRKKLHCPHCKYPLQGLSEAQCPECGKQLTLKEFPAAAGTIP